VITYWNRGAEDLYGWTSQQAIGKTVHDFIHTVFPASLEDIKRELFATGRWEGEIVHTTRDGSKVTVASRWSLQQDGSGRGARTLEINNDITERKRIEESLRRSHAAYLAEAQKLSSTGSFGWDTASEHLFWSEESYRIVGYEPTVQPTIDLVMQRVHPDDVPFVRHAIDRAARDHKELDIEHRLLMPDGEVRHLHVVARPLAEEPNRFVGALMDITARVRAQEMLVRIQSEFAHAARVSMLGELTASIAHEVSQPLGAIATYASAGLHWLDRAEPDLTELRRLNTRILETAGHAADIIARVRGMAIRRGPERTALSINGVIEDALLFLRQELQERGVSVTLDLTQDLPPILGDPTQLQQVVVNLAMNAIQAMTQTGGAPRKLVVRSAADGAAVAVMIADTGSGIAADHLDRLFESFFTTKDGGMGMGLPICRSIVESHGGRMRAGNRDGGGAQFTFTLPVAEALEQA